MKIEKAHMEVMTRNGHADKGVETITLDGGVDLTIRNTEDGQQAEIRRYVEDPLLAANNGQESDDPYVLVDWFLVRDTKVSFHDGRLRIFGYMSGAKGHRRDGTSPYGDGDGNAYIDDEQPLVRVRWDLR